MNTQTLTKMLTDIGIEENEAKYEVKMLLKHFCNYDETEKLRGRTLSPEQYEKIRCKVEQRIKYKMPIQYVIGEAWFMGEYYKVTPSVLIPRDETEVLVRNAIDIINQNNFKTVLDIGTGTGCIACTIAKNTEAVVLGVDISNDALHIALDNVTKLNINNKAVFRKSDLFDNIRKGEKFDLIVSNPPYIPIGTKLSDEVMHEPQIALYAKENGLEFYKKITEHAPKYLNNEGYLMFELGQGEADFVRDFMVHSFENIKIIQDLAHIDRVIIGKLIK